MVDGKKGQITVFIIIGLVILFLVGTFLYMTRVTVESEIEKARPQVLELPTEVQPVRDLVNSCIEQLATDGLRKIGDSGGYVDQKYLKYNPAEPTDAEAIQLSPSAGPTIAYWHHMKSPNSCENECAFDTKAPNLYRKQGGINIETQLDEYINENLKSCTNFEEIQKQGCTVQETGRPNIKTNVAENDVFFAGNYPLRVKCGQQTFDVQDYYVSIDLNLKEIYELARNITAFQSQYQILEQATNTIISTYSGPDERLLPPYRHFDVGPPEPGKFWIKYEVEEKLQQLLTSQIPLIQVSSVRNYNYVDAPEGTRDPALFETIYNRQFFIPQEKGYPLLEARFSYLNWWKPYFNLNCKGQICGADSASNFFLIPITLNRYEFAYDLSYPVMLEIRNPFAFNRQGYTFRIMLEQNMRNSEAFTGTTTTIQTIPGDTPPTIFCDPIHRKSQEITLDVKDELTRAPITGATVSYLCGPHNCNLGTTNDGNFATKFPTCIGGTLRLTKQGYATYSAPLDTDFENPISTGIDLTPTKTIKATIKNYVLTKASKRDQWQFRLGSPTLPPAEQRTTIQMTRKGTTYDEPYFAIIEIEGAKEEDITLIPGKYELSINSFYKGDLVIPPDNRCVKWKNWYGGKEKKCFWLPQENIEFDDKRPFPYGGAELNIELTTDELRGASQIEFRQFVIGIDKIAEEERIVEDLNEIDKVRMYATANTNKLQPVIT